MEEGSGKEETGEHCEATEHVLSRGSNYTARCIPCCLWRLGCKSDGREPATAPLTFDWFVPQTWSTSLCKAVKVMCFTASSFLLRLMKQEIISLPSWHIPDHKLQSHPCFCTTLVQFPLYSQESIQANWYERTGGNKCSHYSAGEPLHKWKVTTGSLFRYSWIFIHSDLHLNSFWGLISPMVTFCSSRLFPGKL